MKTKPDFQPVRISPEELTAEELTALYERAEQLTQLAKIAAVRLHNESVLAGDLTSEFSNQGHRRDITVKPCPHPDCVVTQITGNA